MSHFGLSLLNRIPGSHCQKGKLPEKKSAVTDEQLLANFGRVIQPLTAPERLLPTSRWPVANLLILLCYKISQAPSITKRAGGELLDKMSGNLNS
jgi:hypothetical protein